MNGNRTSSESAAQTKHGIPIRNVWHMLLYAWDRPAEVGRWRGEVESSPTLDALLAKILARLVEQRLRIGLGREYVVVEGSLGCIRGRVDFQRSVRRQMFDRGQAYCRFHSFEADAPRNQILKAVLSRLVKAGRFGDESRETRELRDRLRRLTRNLEPVRDIDVDVEFIRRQNLGRNDRDYSLMHSICEFLLESELPTEEAGERASPQVMRDEERLHNLFEAFATAFYKHHLKGWRITAQKVLSWPAETESRLLPRMRPDIVLVSPHGRTLVLDTKFTGQILTSLREGRPTYDSAHLYQLYTYLRTQDDEPGLTNAEGVLLYPAVRANISESHLIQGHRIRLETVDLAASWEAIETEMLSMVAPG